VLRFSNLKEGVIEMATKFIMSDRVKRLRKTLDKTMREKKEWWGLDLTIMDGKGIEEKPLIIRKALAIDKLLMEMPIHIKEDQLIVGNFVKGSYSLGWVMPQYLTEEEEEWGKNHRLSRKSVWGHSCPDIGIIVNLGAAGLKKKIDQKLVELGERKTASNLGKKTFLEAEKMSLNSVVKWCNRYAKLAEDKAKIESGRRREELLKIADISKKVIEEPAENFYEALQSFMFYFIALHICGNYVPMGRIDQIFYPYLEKDIKEGKINIEQAQELLDCFWMKFSERIDINIQDHFEPHKDPGDFSLGLPEVVKLPPLPLANFWQLTSTLSGVDKDGNDITNLLTYMCLESSHKLKLIHPQPQIRLSKKSPDKLIEKIAEIIKDGVVPIIYNDEVVVKSLANYRDLPIEIARNYAGEGCWELLVPGITEFRYYHIEALQLLEFTLNRGRSRVKQELDPLDFDYNQNFNSSIEWQKGLDLGDPLEWNSFEEVFNKYKMQLDHALEQFIMKANSVYLSLSKIAPTLLMSAVMHGCIEKAQDMVQGGAYEVVWSPMLTGISDAADSLAVIKKFVFEEKRITMKELLEALDNNFPDEAMRQELINKVPKFGINDDYVDEISKELVIYIIERIKYHERCVAREDNIKIKFAPGIGTFEKYKTCGELVGATPNGRRAKDAISVNMSPEAGLAKKGITTALKSFVKLPLEKITSGSPIELAINENMIKGEKGLKNLKAFIKAFIDMGGSITAIKVSDVNTLLDAQKNPEKHKDLTVKMGGWQAYFTALDTKHQDYHIRRMKDAHI